MTSDARGFPTSEFTARVAKAQTLMAEENLSALVLTSEPDVRYFSGFLTRFWESPTRPWFLIVPVTGAPVAVIPSIGHALMARTWITDIRTWRAPGLPLPICSTPWTRLSPVGPVDLIPGDGPWAGDATDRRAVVDSR